MTDPGPRSEDPGAVDVIRSLVVPIYVPWLGMALCLGMISLALPLYLADIGLGYVELSAVLAAAGLGAMVSGLPAGDGLARLGAKPTLLAALGLLALTTVLLAATDDVVVLFSLQFLAGAGTIAVRLTAQSWVTDRVATGLRGRALSAMGGLRRFGLFVGPILAGGLIEAVGYRLTFMASGLVAAIGMAPVILRRWPGRTARRHRTSLRQVLARHGRRLLVAASGPILIMAVRRGRNVVLPLIGDELGISPAAVGLLVAVSTGADLALFPAAGVLMDRFGRLTAIVPAFTLMGLGLVGLGLAGSGSAVAVAGAVIGIGNGLSAGTMMTLGSDLAPEEATSQFLAGFASLQVWGGVLGPLGVGWLAAAVGLGASAVALGGLMFVGVALIVLTVGETGVARARPAG